MHVLVAMTKEIQLQADIALLPVTRLKAGMLTCLYELGKLRYICIAQTELIREIYPAVRDEHWGTLPCSIVTEQLVQREDSFTIKFTAIYYQGIPVYEAQYIIEGGKDSRIVFSMSGKVLSAFRKNRIGLCVLHPVKENCGQAVAITRPDGSCYEANFPVQIAPWQPFHEIKEMRWSTKNGCSATLFFEGDVFETEDQRNWSDHSFKTYSTPQSIPFPVTVKEGEQVAQEIRLLVDTTEQRVPVPAAIAEEKIPFPAIGYGRQLGQPVLTPAVLLLLQKIPFHHYRVVLAMDKQDWQRELAIALAEAAQMNILLELVLFFSDDFSNELELLLPLLKEKQALLLSLLPLQNGHAVTPAALLQHVYPRIKNVLPAVLVGYGTDLFFTEVNRQRPALLTFDFVSFSMHPQVHAADTRSLLENLQSQPDIVATAAGFAAGKPVFVSPVTLKDRYYLPTPDKRQYLQFTAFWMIMSIGQLSMAGSITYFELMGEAGLLQYKTGSENGEDWVIRSAVYEVLASIHAFQPAWIIRRHSGEENLMDGLLLENAKGVRLLFKAPDAYRLFKSQ